MLGGGADGLASSTMGVGSGASNGIGSGNMLVPGVTGPPSPTHRQAHGIHLDGSGPALTLQPSRDQILLQQQRVRVPFLLFFLVALWPTSCDMITTLL